MPVYYVNKSGNDANSGLSRALAKLTIQAAHNTATNYDTIRVGSGEYREQVTQSIHMLVEADVDSPNSPSGYVVIDGENIRSYGITSGSAYTLGARGLTFRRCVSYGISTLGQVTLDRCTFREGPYGTYSSNYSSATRCLFLGLSSGAITGGFWQLSHNLFSNCAYGFASAGYGGIVNTRIFDNVFLNCTRDIDFSGLTASNIAAFVIDNNSHYGWVTAIGRLGVTDYATLGTWQAASGKEASSLSADPLLLDPAKGLYFSRTDSPLRGVGFYGETIGLGTGEGVSNNRNPLLWSGGIFSGTLLAGSGNIEQSVPGVNGTYSTDVLDLTQSRSISAFADGAIVTYPSDVLDHSIADTAPNRPTLEVRYSDSAFLAGDGAPSWVAYERMLALGASIKARYWQFRYVLRSNGVAA